MKNEIQVFVNNLFGSVRILTQNDGKVLFCGKDVAEALGYAIPRKAITDHCQKDGVLKWNVIDNLGRTQEANFITEGNLYRLITHSKLPDAEKFEKWVFDEVIPSIRKHGAYIPEQKQLTPIEMIASIANNAVETERRLNLAESKLNDMQTSIDNTSSKLNQALDVFTETFAVPDWSACMNRRINAVITQNGLNHQTERGNLYKELENLARCNLNVRKANKQKRMKKSGAKSKEIQAVSKLDVISDDAQLRAIFDGIVRKFEARYIQGDNVQMGIPEVIE